MWENNTYAACSEEWSIPVLSRFGLAEKHKIKAWFHRAKPWRDKIKPWRDEAKLGFYVLIMYSQDLNFGAGEEY